MLPWKGRNLGEQYTSVNHCQNQIIANDRIFSWYYAYLNLKIMSATGLRSLIQVWQNKVVSLIAWFNPCALSYRQAGQDELVSGPPGQYPSSDGGRGSHKHACNIVDQLGNFWHSWECRTNQFQRFGNRIVHGIGQVCHICNVAVVLLHIARVVSWLLRPQWLTACAPDRRHDWVDPATTLELLLGHNEAAVIKGFRRSVYGKAQ